MANLGIPRPDLAGTTMITSKFHESIMRMSCAVEAMEGKLEELGDGGLTMVNVMRSLWGAGRFDHMGRWKIYRASGNLSWALPEEAMITHAGVVHLL